MDKLLFKPNWNSDKYYVVLIAIGIVFFILGYILYIRFPTTSYELSRDNWTGIVTSPFIYDSWVNALAFFIFLILYAIENFNRSSVFKRNLTAFSSVIIFVSAIAANGLWYLFIVRFQQTSYGQSGVVMALLGVVWALAVDNVWKYNKFLTRDYRTKLKQVDRMKYHNEFFLFTVSLLIVFAPISVIDSGPANANIFVHFVSFFVGFLITYGYLKFTSKKK